MENVVTRDALGHRTERPVGWVTLLCGHAVALDFNHDELCPFCIDYDDARARDAAARAQEWDEG